MMWCDVMSVPSSERLWFGRDISVLLCRRLPWLYEGAITIGSLVRYVAPHKSNCVLATENDTFCLARRAVINHWSSRVYRITCISETCPTGRNTLLTMWTLPVNSFELHSSSVNVIRDCDSTTVFTSAEKYQMTPRVWNSVLRQHIAVLTEC